MPVVIKREVVAHLERQYSEAFETQKQSSSKKKENKATNLLSILTTYKEYNSFPQIAGSNSR